jgi:1-acyl-sn-glycerol-3-phosphate acyltransferase
MAEAAQAPAVRPEYSDNFLYAYSKFWINVFASLYFRIEAHGLENVPKKGAVILASNHASDVDPPLVALRVPRQCHFLAKDELFKIPVLGTFVKGVHSHPIRRGVMDRSALRTCEEVLAAGNVLIMFPEGTRTRDGELQAAKPGVALIAAHSGAPIVPVYIDGTFGVMPRGSKMPRPKKIRVFYGEPFTSADIVAERHERNEKVAAEIMNRIAALKKSALK